MLLRFDAGTIGELRRTPSGGVVVPAAITRTGVFPYRQADGTIIRELRLPEDVFDPASLASLEHATVTDRHPPELITPNNHRTYSRGHVASVPKHEPTARYVNADLAVNDAELIGKIERKDAKEISAGYTCKHEIAEGVYEGEPYDRIQREIRYNHVAIGPAGWNRAGREVALRMDAGAAVLDESQGLAPRRGEDPVKKIPKISLDVRKRALRLDDVSYPIRTADERDLAKNAVESAMRRCKEMIRTDALDAAGMQAAMQELMATFETLQSQIMAFVDGMTADASATSAAEEKPPEEKPVVQDTGAAPASAAEEKKMDAAEIDRRVTERVALIGRVQALAPKIKHDGKTNLELMLETIKVVDPTIKMDAGDEKNEALVSGMFRALRLASSSSADAHRAIIAAQRTDGGEESRLEKAKREAREKTANAWQTPAK